MNHPDGAKAIAALIDTGATLDILSDSGDTPLIRAASQGYSSVVLHLLEAGANPLIQALDGCSPLHYAYCLDHPTVTALIDAGIYINVEAEIEYTPLSCAAEHGCLATMRWLQDAGANPTISIRISTDVVQFAAKAMRYEEGAEIVKIVLSADSTLVNKPNEAGVTLLQLALSIGSYSLLNVVLAAGADVRLLNKPDNLTLSLITVLNNRFTTTGIKWISCKYDM